MPTKKATASVFLAAAPTKKAPASRLKDYKVEAKNIKP